MFSACAVVSACTKHTCITHVTMNCEKQQHDRALEGLTIYCSITMRHGMVGRKLNRTWAHRESMFKTMVCQLIQHDAINTTLPKVKILVCTIK